MRAAVKELHYGAGRARCRTSRPAPMPRLRGWELERRVFDRRYVRRNDTRLEIAIGDVPTPRSNLDERGYMALIVERGRRLQSKTCLADYRPTFNVIHYLADEITERLAIFGLKFVERSESDATKERALLRASTDFDMPSASPQESHDPDH